MHYHKAVKEKQKNSQIRWEKIFSEEGQVEWLLKQNDNPLIIEF